MNIQRERFNVSKFGPEFENRYAVWLVANDDIICDNIVNFILYILENFVSDNVIVYQTYENQKDLLKQCYAHRLE